MDLAELTRVLMCVCLDVYEWLGASVYYISSPTVLHSSSAVAEILDRLAASSVLSTSVPSTSRLSKTPVPSSSSSFLSQHKTASLYVHSSFRVSCYEAVGSPFVQLKLPPFCLSGLFFFSFFFILVLIAVVVCLSWTPYFTPGSLLFGTHRP